MPGLAGIRDFASFRSKIPSAFGIDQANDSTVLLPFLDHLNETRTSLSDASSCQSNFSAAPFVGAAISLLMLGEVPTPSFWVTAGLMGIGIWLHLTERHEHEHVHEALFHAHPHVHEEHHQHEHDFEWDGSEPHTHPHHHAPIRHTHHHYPDIHHRHER
jgi:hypothetical protein